VLARELSDSCELLFSHEKIICAVFWELDVGTGRKKQSFIGEREHNKV
jgi:hypothetical protein